MDKASTKRKYAMFFVIMGFMCVATTQVVAERNCYSGTGYSSKKFYAGVINIVHAKRLARSQAIFRWEQQAKARLRAPVSWSAATRRKIIYRHGPRNIRASARATLCFNIINRTPPRNQKCPPQDIRCKARNFKYKRKNRFPTPGVRRVPNPRPSPSGRVIVR